MVGDQLMTDIRASPELEFAQVGQAFGEIRCLGNQA